jgi:uncharacterized protein YecT (DUF1311 family)
MIRVPAATCVFSIALAGSAFAQTDEEVASHLTPAVHACESAPENGGTFEQALCYKDELARQDQRLNDLWSQVLSRLKPGRREALRQKERHWIKDRDADCREEAQAYVDSTAAYMFNRCMTDESIRRTMWLEKVQ